MHFDVKSVNCHGGGELSAKGLNLFTIGGSFIYNS